MKSQHHFRQQCLYLLLVVTGIVSANDWANTIKEDFEDNERAHGSWYTNTKLSHFRMINGTEGQKQSAPAADATTGTAKGRYSLANYDNYNNSRWLFSSCFPPSGPGCVLNFSAVIKLEEDEEFAVCAMKQCHSCQTIHFSKSHDCVHVHERTDRWTEMSVPIASIPTPFDISFGVSFLYPGSFLAIDDIKLVGCERGYVTEVICSHNEVLQCDYTHKCLRRDRLCDLHLDCECGEDENEECDAIPLEGRLDLRECDFYSDKCPWFDLRPEDDFQTPGANDANNTTSSFRWRLVDPDGNSDVHETIYTYESDIHLSVDLPQQDPPIVAILQSVDFQPRMSTVPYCEIRFMYKLSNATLQLFMMTRSDVNVTHVELWSMSDHFLASTSATKDTHDWYRAVVDINSQPIHTHYVLQLAATSQSGSSPGRAAVQMLTMDRDCFSPDFILTQCGSYGSQGPTPSDCHDHYPLSHDIQVIGDGLEKGVQMWTVPETGIYRIQAFGARGGLGLHTLDLVKNSRGSKVEAEFSLTGGDKLHVLVGQEGLEVCAPESWTMFPRFCRPNESFVGGGGGGGGGGGATIVYTKDKSDNPIILLVAGGGGGLPSELLNPGAQNNGMATHSQEETMMTEEEAVGVLTGRLEGAHGCRDSSNQMMYFGGTGGFGAGGGACASGGHGGGADIKKGHREDKQFHVGLPGRSYAYPSAISPAFHPDFNPAEGHVEIYLEKRCECHYTCAWLDDKRDKTTCVCPTGSELHADGFSCIDSSNMTLTADTGSSNQLPLYIGIGVACLVILVVCICLYIHRPNLRNRAPHGMKKMTSVMCPCVILNRRSQVFGTHVLPQIARAPAVMHENPHYNLVTTSDTGLHEVNRKHLRLMSELGQGAFGQVFYGQLSHVPTVGELPVAIKTLPAFCTEQTEMDFLLEAVIVSKFNHPNIVQFIGVCFEQHPHYLVLELLEGGDLKTFLRHARPKWDQPSTLTMLDLLRLALDVARGCQHLEEKHFIHRDIAARNCLLTTKGPNRIAKIADFGMARDIYRSDYYKKAGKAMLPVKWMPPEAFLDGLFTAKTDVWSYGILLWEVFSLGHVPYPGCSNEEVMNLVTKGGRLDPPAGCPSAIFDVMMSCWAGMAEKRPTFALIISILERTIQDDETISKGLPVCYVPPPIHPAGVRIRDGSLSPRPIPVPAGGATCMGHRGPKLRAHSVLDHDQGYLKPLLSSTDAHSPSPLPRSLFSDTPMTSQLPKVPENASGNVSLSTDSSWDAERSKSGRVPKIFYRPGTCDITIENPPGDSAQGQRNCPSIDASDRTEAAAMPHEKGQD